LFDLHSLLAAFVNLITMCLSNWL